MLALLPGPCQLLTPCAKTVRLREGTDGLDSRPFQRRESCQKAIKFTAWLCKKKAFALYGVQTVSKVVPGS